MLTFGSHRPYPVEHQMCTGASACYTADTAHFPNIVSSVCDTEHSYPGVSERRRSLGSVSPNSHLTYAFGARFRTRPPSVLSCSTIEVRWYVIGKAEVLVSESAVEPWRGSRGREWRESESAVCFAEGQLEELFAAIFEGQLSALVPRAHMFLLSMHMVIRYFLVDMVFAGAALLTARTTRRSRSAE